MEVGVDIVIIFRGEKKTEILAFVKLPRVDFRAESPPSGFYLLTAFSIVQLINNTVCSKDEKTNIKIHKR